MFMRNDQVMLYFDFFGYCFFLVIESMNVVKALMKVLMLFLFLGKMLKKLQV